MKVWDSPQEIALDAQIVVKVVNMFFGIYVWVPPFASLHTILTCWADRWDFLFTFPFYWAFIARKKAFRWPLVGSMTLFTTFKWRAPSGQSFYFAN